MISNEITKIAIDALKAEIASRPHWADKASTEKKVLTDVKEVVVGFDKDQLNWFPIGLTENSITYRLRQVDSWSSSLSEIPVRRMKIQ